MQRKDSMLLGIVLGLILPIMAYVFTSYTDIIAQIMPRKPIGLYVLALTGNMIAVWYCYRNDCQQLGKGIVLVTFLSMLLAVITKTVMI
ncbi:MULTISPECIES: hypothetical protein [Sphingobacterium]|uniref:Stationary phase survival protein SurE n=1 Tax=Sphingobacterium populi TaxID=1812824 RepID=A0ABW5UB71_9SPHI|nr:hypothetical protein [Sphingobacterium sp. CFCC 11742]